MDEIPHDRKRRLVAVLLEKHPPQHFRLCPPAAWPQLRILREIIENGARFRQNVSVFEDDSGHFSDRIDFEIFRPPRLASRLRDVDTAVLDLQAVEQHLHLVHVSRLEIAEQGDHCTKSPSARRLAPTSCRSTAMVLIKA